MSRGQASGIDRKYQEYCRDFLFRTQPGLTAYSGDGCDVPFACGGTTWTLDVALLCPTGALVVAECRRTKAAEKQNEIAAFAYKVERLREALDVEVSGVFFAKSAPQLGLVKVGTHDGIAVAVLAEGGNPAHGFSMAFHRYDKQRERRLRDYLMTAETGHYKLTGGNVTFTLNRKRS